MVLDFHLHVQPCELAQVAARVRFLLAEHRTDLENALHVATDGSLLVELRRLCEAGGALVEVVGGEHSCTSLRLAADKLRRLDLREPARVQRLAEELAHSGAHAQHRAGRSGAQVDPAVVEPLVGRHPRPRAVGGFGGDDLLLGAHRVVELEGQLRLRARDCKHALDRELDALDRGGVDGGLLESPLHVHDRLGRKATEPLDEGFGGVGVLLVLEVARLQRVEHALAQHEEARVALAAHLGHARADPDALAHLRPARCEHRAQLCVLAAAGGLRHHGLVVAIPHRAFTLIAAGRREWHPGSGGRLGRRGRRSRRRHGRRVQPGKVRLACS
mmetsp:Transcript_38070/g.94458  ORF Transcript_38070/g.94458 Transcript_38070/m.94458 type:complete len:330 (-) Transcript_38070:166-1155(-)